MTYEQAQRMAREKGVSAPRYVVVRVLVAPRKCGWLGLQRRHAAFRVLWSRHAERDRRRRRRGGRR